MLAALVALCLADLAAADATCSAGDSTCTAPGEEGAVGGITATDPYYWPMAMGHPKYYSNPPWPGPTDLKKSFAWEWFGPNGTRYEEAFVAGVIDDKKNVYVFGHEHAYKLDQEGQMSWMSQAPSPISADGPVIYKGLLYGATYAGEIFAMDMESGTKRWVTNASTHVGGEYSQLAAHHGVLVTRGDKRCQEKPWQSCAAANVRGLNTTDGRVLWTYHADGVLWDWFPQFPDDESVIFMDATGGLYKLELQTGALLWKAPGLNPSWTDGSQFVASNGITYTVQVSFEKCSPWRWGYVTDCEGYLTAYRTSDGSRLWQVTVPKPPNSSPVVGRLGKDEKLTLVMPIGQQSPDGCVVPGVRTAYEVLSFLPFALQHLIFLPLHALSKWLGDSNWLLWGSQTRTHDVLAFDAETGKPLWTWQGPTTNRKCNAGDEDGFVSRYEKRIRTICCPTPWGQARIDSAGTIYVPNENGDFFAIRDANGDGRIGEDEVSVYHTGGTFPHCGTAHAPGMLVAVNFDGVFAWKI